MSLRTLFYAAGLTIMLGWLLFVGAQIVTPLIWAIIAVYTLQRADDALARLPLIGAAPRLIRRLAMLIMALVAIFSFGVLIATNINQIIAQLPLYQANLEGLVTSLAGRFGLDEARSWEAAYNATIGQLNLQAIALGVVGSVANFGSLVVLVAIYALFLSAEAPQFVRKTQVALGEDADHSIAIVASINERVGDYLATKTLINIILAAISFGVMTLIGVDFALFWAVLIGLLNYVPYIGSLMGVVFPVLLSLAQFGSIATALSTAVFLTVAQMFVGNYLEPKMIGKSVNLSPIVVLVALVVWSALWGLQGAILSVPMTSMLMIIFASIPDTKPIAIFLSSDGDV